MKKVHLHCTDIDTLTVIRERKLASWFKWTLTGTIQYHCMQDDFLYVVVRNGASNKDQLLKYSIKMDANTFAIAENRVHLDHLMEIPKLISASTYLQCYN